MEPSQPRFRIRQVQFLAVGGELSSSIDTNVGCTSLKLLLVTQTDSLKASPDFLESSPATGSPVCTTLIRVRELHVAGTVGSRLEQLRLPLTEGGTEVPDGWLVFHPVLRNLGVLKVREVQPVLPPSHHRVPRSLPGVVTQPVSHRRLKLEPVGCTARRVAHGDDPQVSRQVEVANLAFADDAKHGSLNRWRAGSQLVDDESRGLLVCHHGPVKRHHLTVPLAIRLNDAGVATHVRRVDDRPNQAEWLSSSPPDESLGNLGLH